MKSPRISGLLVCQDNEATIGPVVTSLAQLCDEVLVVDGGSQDRTIERALVHDSVRLYERPFPGNIADQKNFAMDQRLGDWILVLDTDELIGGITRKSLRCLTRIPGMHWFSIPRYWLIERDGELQYLSGSRHYRDRQLRLFRNLPGFRYDHERNPIHHEVRERVGWGRPLRGPHIYHFDLLLNDRAKREAKVERYRSIEPGSDHLHSMYLWEEQNLPSTLLGHEPPGWLGPPRPPAG